MRTRAGRRPRLLTILLGGLLALFLGTAPAQETEKSAGEGAGKGATQAHGEPAREPSSGAQGDGEAARAEASAARGEGGDETEGAVRRPSANDRFFSEFPGFDLGHLSQEQRDWVLRRARSVSCTCGCRGETVGRCVVLDPTCQTARQMLQEMIERAGRLGRDETPAPAGTGAGGGGTEE
jgi:hypothetical protein